MNTLLVVLPFCEKDIDAAISLMCWIGEMDNCLTKFPNAILLAADAAVPLEKCKELKALAQLVFTTVETTTVRVMAKDWRAPNEMFHALATFIKSHYKLPFFWMEPDCIPLNPAWLNALEQAYERTPRRYLGALVESTQEGLPPLHLAGCAVYPNDAIDMLGKYCDAKAESAWDIGSAKEIVAGYNAASTGLIQSFYGEQDLIPSFVTQKKQGEQYAANVFDLSFLNERAVLFHRVKDGSLIQSLAVQKLNSELPGNYHPNPEDMVVKPVEKTDTVKSYPHLEKARAARLAKRSQSKLPTDSPAEQEQIAT